MWAAMHVTTQQSTAHVTEEFHSGQRRDALCTVNSTLCRVKTPGASRKKKTTKKKTKHCTAWSYSERSGAASISAVQGTDGAEVRHVLFTQCKLQRKRLLCRNTSATHSVWTHCKHNVLSFILIIWSVFQKASKLYEHTLNYGQNKRVN